MRTLKNLRRITSGLKKHYTIQTNESPERFLRVFQTHVAEAYVVSLYIKLVAINSSPTIFLAVSFLYKADFFVPDVIILILEQDNDGAQTGAILFRGLCSIDFDNVV